MAGLEPFGICRRWVPEVSFPSHHYIPGRSPRPTPVGLDALANADNWLANRSYLLGVDHFNFAYWWEAHEYWEYLWRAAPRCGRLRPFLQGLIQVAAALVKWYQGNPRGMRKLTLKARSRLNRVADLSEGGTYMGLDLADFDRRVRHIFELSSQAEMPREMLQVPHLAPLIHLQASGAPTNSVGGMEGRS